MTEILLLLRVALAAVFSVAGLAKLRDRAGVRKTVVAFGVPDSLAGPVAALLPVAELGLAVALLPMATARWGAVGLLALLAVFTTAMLVTMGRGKSVDCRCFGQLTAAPIGPSAVARNAGLGAMAVAVAFGAPDGGGSLIAWLGTRSGGEMLNLVLGGVIVAGVFVVIQLLKQYGKLLLRVEALEARGGAAAPAQAQAAGLPVGTAVPVAALTSLDGGPTTLESLSAKGKSVLFVFVEPGCSACDALLPEVAAWQRDYERLTVALVSTGASQTRAKVMKHGIRNLVLQKDREFADSLKVTANPSAVLVRDGAIASPLSAGAEAIRALAIAASLPPPLSSGDVVPAMKVETLANGTIDLGNLRRRSLLLFWNPGCGFCQQMLARVKEWERSTGDLSLIVVSSGAAADIKAQGFQSPVVLDPSFAVGRVFAATGTPSAVLIEGGRLASGVEAGAPGVWKLTGVRDSVPA